jgi:hypothetical protein
MKPTTSPGFLSGIIEGFYGRPWSHETRLNYADYLQGLGLNCAVYCPKADPYLRKHWREHWPRSQWRALQDLAAHYRRRGLVWGPGLSPFALYQNYGDVQRRELRRKVLQLQELEPGCLAILFDDMPGGLADLAARQSAIIEDICHWLPQMRILVCPTYYSLDPVLERHFGARPADYWLDLGRRLPPDVAIFWTGNRVCSEAITVEDVLAISGQLRRPLVLWDNYPVNDGAVRSRYLYCDPLPGRQADLKQHLAGHLCNPMNQGVMSLPALTGLAALYGNRVQEDAWLPRVLGPETWQRLLENRDEFQSQGLDGMGERRCLELAGRYQALPGRAAAEVAGWLRGEYNFDPACLTD